MSHRHRVPRRSSVAFLIALALAAAPARAQNDAPHAEAADSVTTILPPITVMVERELAAPPPVTTLTVSREELRRTEAENPYDLLRRVTGIEVHDHGQGPGFAPNVVLRGFTSDHSSDVLLVLDGVPVNLPMNGHQEGYADWYLLLAHAVSSMRVIHGPASPLYGDFALGGVVEVFTPHDASETAASLSASTESDVAGWVHTGFRKEGSGGLATVEVRREDGWRENSGAWLGNGLLRGWRSLGGGRIEGGIQLYATEWDSPGFVSVAQFNAGDLERAVDPTDGGDARRAILHGRYSRSLWAGASMETLAWVHHSRSSVFLNVPGEESVTGQTDEEDERTGGGGHVELSWRPALGEVTLGVSGRAEGAEYRLAETEERHRVEDQKSFRGRYATGAAFVRWRATLLGRLGLDLGARVDGVRHASLDRLAEDARWESETDVIAAPKLGARLRVRPTTALVASASRGFRSPTGVIEDPHLPPFLAWSLEAGVEHATENVSLSAALFRLNVDNERVQDPVTREIESIGSSVRQGVDVRGTLQLPAGMTLFASGVLNDAELEDDVDAQGERTEGSSPALPAVRPTRSNGGAAAPVLAHEGALEPGDRVPAVARYTGRVGVEALVAGRIGARVTWRFTGPYSPIGEPDVRTKSYGVLDLGASLPWPHAAGTLDVELQNVLDERYPEVRASGFINPGAPRRLLAAVRLNP